MELSDAKREIATMREQLTGFKIGRSHV